MRSGERRVLIITGITALLVALRPTLILVLHRLQVIPVEATPRDMIQDGTLMMGMALVLFIVPTGAGKGESLLDWHGASRIPWGTLVLFGGGLAIANGFETSGLARWMGNQLGDLGGLPPVVLTLVVCLLVTFLTEVTWSRGLPIILMPILADLARRANLNPMILMMPAAISAAFAFAMPVGSASCAVAYSSGQVPVSRMVRAGIVLNLVGVLVVTAYVYIYLVSVLGMSIQAPEWAPR
jgi:sodium-dependent dicarboxylate transporter 2/3/5